MAATPDNPATAPDDEPHVELERFLPYRISVLSLAVSQSIARLYSERFSISIPEWRAIAVLGNYQPLTANEICERTSMDKVQVSRAVGRLVSAGLLLRQTDRNDRRRANLRLSARGLRIYRDIVPLAKECEARLLSALTPAEQTEFDRLLHKLQARARDLCGEA